MHEALKLLLLYLHSMWKYRWRAMATVWLICLAFWTYVYTIPDQFEGRASVYIDTDSVLKPLLRGLAVETNVMNEVNMMAKVLKSRPNLEKVVRETDLGHRATTSRQMNELIGDLGNKIRIIQNRNNLFEIKYTDPNRNMAGVVVQNLLNSLVEDTLGAKRTDTTSAQEFLVKQISLYEKRLADAEERLAQFKQKNVGMMPTQGGDYYTRLQEAMLRLEQTKAILTVSRRRSREIQRQLDGDVPAFFGLSMPTVQSAPVEDDERIREYQSKLDQLLLNYTDEHPVVINLKENIAQLKEQLKAEHLEMSQTYGGGNTEPLEMNPVYQQMQTALNQSKVEIATLAGQMQEQQAAVDKLRKAVDTIPEVEAELKRLNRDYNVTKAQYEQLLERLESARISEEAERSSDEVKFRILDPVNVPLKPIGPPRTLLLIVGVFAGLSSGIGLALLMVIMQPVFVSRHSFKDTLSLPVFGTVSLVLTRGQMLRRRFEMATFFLVFLLLMFAAGGAIVFQDNGVQIAQKFIRYQMSA